MGHQLPSDCRKNRICDLENLQGQRQSLVHLANHMYDATFQGPSPLGATPSVFAAPPTGCRFFHRANFRPTGKTSGSGPTHKAPRLLSVDFSGPAPGAGAGGWTPGAAPDWGTSAPRTATASCGPSAFGLRSKGGRQLLGPRKGRILRGSQHYLKSQAAQRPVEWP